MNIYYTGVDPKQEFCKLGDYWEITGNLEGGKAHLATGVGHLPWVTCPGSPVLGSLGDHWGIYRNALRSIGRLGNWEAGEALQEWLGIYRNTLGSTGIPWDL